jgi:tRNA dimethylallyltransferase
MKAPTRRSAVLLMGPTGSGKSDLAVQLAEKLPLEIISVDSALVYRGMDIGTAKPTLATRARIPHHLIDTRDPKMGYSVVSSCSTHSGRCRKSGRGGANPCWWAGP